MKIIINFVYVNHVFCRQYHKSNSPSIKFDAPVEKFSSHFPEDLIEFVLKLNLSSSPLVNDSA